MRAETQQQLAQQLRAQFGMPLQSKPQLMEWLDGIDQKYQLVVFYHGQNKALADKLLGGQRGAETSYKEKGIRAAAVKAGGNPRALLQYDDGEGFMVGDLEAWTTINPNAQKLVGPINPKVVIREQHPDPAFEKYRKGFRMTTYPASAQATAVPVPSFPKEGKEGKCVPTLQVVQLFEPGSDPEVYRLEFVRTPYDKLLAAFPTWEQVGKEAHNVSPPLALITPRTKIPEVLTAVELTAHLQKNYWPQLGL